MEKTPIKKFEKVLSEKNHRETVVVIKITDFRNHQVVYAVTDSQRELFFNSLDDARAHVKKQVASPDKKIPSSLSIA